nr:hypothetical protein GCM10025730_07440 [Promicromonospora thailandica]
MVTDDGEVVGLVSAGVTLDRLWDSIVPRLVVVGVATLLAFGAGAVAATLLARRLDRITDSRGPDELAHLFAAHEAVLHSVEEGMLLIEGGTVVLANDEALRLLGATDLAAPFAVADPRLSPRCATCWPVRPPRARSAWATACCSWGGRRPRRVAGAWARWSRCATAPSCSGSPASCPRCGPSPRRCAPRRTTSATACTPSPPSSSWAAATRPCASWPGSATWASG